MSQQQQQPQQEEERVCYVHCNFCNTVLAVSVPCSSMLGMVTVRCGYCSNLLSLNIMPNVHAPPRSLLEESNGRDKEKLSTFGEEGINNIINVKGPPSHSKYTSTSTSTSTSTRSDNNRGKRFHHQQQQPSSSSSSSFHSSLQLPPIRPPEKRQRVPSAYNRFIKEEIQRIKTSNPDITHREAFSTAAKNWAHFPHIHFGLNLQGKKEKQAKLEDHPHPIHHQTGTNINTNTKNNYNNN